jgi:lysophospholipase L1-like esterase
MTKRIMCFGDSLTWGWNPTFAGVPVERYARDKRWPGVLARQLGDGYEIVEEGLSGRTTAVDDPFDPRLNGAAYLPAALASHLPLDLVILMLGTNDTKAYFNRTPFDIAASMGTLVNQVATSTGGVGTAYPAPRVLIMAPPPLAREMPSAWLAELFRGGREKTTMLSAHYRKLAEFLQVPLFNVGDVISTNGVDGIHFSEQNNLDLGMSLATFIACDVLPET